MDPYRIRSIASRVAALDSDEVDWDEAVDNVFALYKGKWQDMYDPLSNDYTQYQIISIDSLEPGEFEGTIRMKDGRVYDFPADMNEGIEIDEPILGKMPLGRYVWYEVTKALMFSLEDELGEDMPPPKGFGGEPIPLGEAQILPKSRGN